MSGMPIPMPADPRITAALRIAMQYGSIEGDHHRAWVIDQMVRALTDDMYELWVALHNAPEDGSGPYEWDIGIAP